MNPSMAAADRDCTDEARYPNISRAELAPLVQSKKAFVVDVNSKEKFKKSGIPGALHFGSNEKVFAEKLPKEKDALIVAYCGGPMCTAWKKAAERACNLGYSNIRHFKEGLQGWAAGS
ncbi:MAG: rhodanese-like domain-containing protein [Bdellovibrionota bacterium]